MQLIDTHCHLQSDFFESSEVETLVKGAQQAGVEWMLCVGTTLADSAEAIKIANKFPDTVRASVGIHPHEAIKMSEQEIKQQLARLEMLAQDPMVKAIGECGFDFYYNSQDEAYSSQKKLLEGQLMIAEQQNLPVSFHVREGFAEFWPIYDQFKSVKGVLHSFTDRQAEVDKALTKGLKIGVNGISTFTSHSWQKDLFKSLPHDCIVVETDTPFLTPTPKRGKINTPENVIYITKFLAELRGEDAKHIAATTTRNASELFGFAVS